MAAALSDMLLYFGVHVLSNVTQNPQFLQPPHEQAKVAGTFLKWLLQCFMFNQSQTV